MALAPRLRERSRRPLTRLVAVGTAAVLLLSGCTGDLQSDGSTPTAAPESSSATEETGSALPDAGDQPLEELGTSAAADLPTDPAEDPDYAEYYGQQIEWGSCEDLDAGGAECGTITVPMVWNDPSAGDIEIAVGRIEATGESIGSLVVNPGGPGGSGVNFLENAATVLSPSVRESYDVVGFDPRGVYRSAGIECLSDVETSEFLAASGVPGTPEAVEQAEAWNERIAEGCQAHSGEILPYLDTYSAARDMDVLRAALGSEQLDYLGYSYGTYLGASYAELYPDRVGRFVLDGAIDPSLNRNQLAADRARSFAGALEEFLDACLAQADSVCPFEGTVEEAKQQLLDFYASLDSAPMDSGDPERPVTGNMARAVVLTQLYENRIWRHGREALRTAMEDGDGSLLLELADMTSERQEDGGLRTNGVFMHRAVDCLDHPGVADEAWAQQHRELMSERFPIVAPGTAGDYCTPWPVPPLRAPAPVSAEGAGPIMVIGTIGDPATPYEWSQSLAEQLDDAVLLTYEGNGHTAYGRSGGCIESEVDAYLLDGTVPEDGYTC